MGESGTFFKAAMAVWILFLGFGLAQAQPGHGEYAGPEACGACHAEQYANYSKYAKKAHSFEHIEILRSKLSAEEVQQCYACHTTGYGRDGGFVSLESTPTLRNVSCETCHGPGAAHAGSGDPKLIRRVMPISECQVCHNEERVRSFGFKPIISAGAH